MVDTTAVTFISLSWRGNNIANQEEHHRKLTFGEELAGVENDPKWLN